MFPNLGHFQKIYYRSFYRHDYSNSVDAVGTHTEIIQRLLQDRDRAIFLSHRHQILLSTRRYFNPLSTPLHTPLSKTLKNVSHTQCVYVVPTIQKVNKGISQYSIYRPTFVIETHCV
jgi:hypothetical protein